MDSLSDFLSSLGAGILFVGGTIALVLASYFVARRLLHPGNEGDRTLEVASTVAVRIATLHALILGLVYAQELDDYKGVRSTLLDEAVAISDVWNDATRYTAERNPQYSLTSSNAIQNADHNSAISMYFSNFVLVISNVGSKDDAIQHSRDNERSEPLCPV